MLAKPGAVLVKPGAVLAKPGAVLVNPGAVKASEYLSCWLQFAAPLPSQSSTSDKAGVHAGGVKENSSLASNMQGSRLKGKAGAQACLPALAKSAGGKQVPMQLVSLPAVSNHLCAELTEWTLSDLRIRVLRLPFSLPLCPPPPWPPLKVTPPKHHPALFPPCTPSHTEHYPCQSPSKHPPSLFAPCLVVRVVFAGSTPRPGVSCCRSTS